MLNSCKKCALGDTRTKLVFGVGDRNADLMFIGEGPGEQEDLKGEPFVGRAGKLLDELLLSIGMTRGDVYIANIVKCRPPNNRDPLGLEQDACIGYLREQVRLVAPKIIVCLGKVAASRIIRENYPITKEHGVFEKRAGVWLTATLHPAYLLRSPSKKADAFADFCAIEDKLGEVLTSP